MPVAPSPVASITTPVWPREVATHGQQAGITSITFYGLTRHTSFDAIAVTLRARLASVLAANPWVAGRLIEEGPALEYPSSAGDGAALVDTVFSTATNEVIHPELRYDTLSAACQSLGVGTAAELFGASAAVSRLALVDVSPTCCAMIFSMSHVAVDGYTYYRILNMLADGVEAEPLDPVRMPLAEWEAAAARLLGAPEAKWIDGAVLIKSVMMGLAHEPPTRTLGYHVDEERIRALKAKAKTEPGAQPFVSTNDILASHYFRATSCGVGVMAVNMRGRLPVPAWSNAGNYEVTALYDAQSYLSPNQIRASLSTPGTIRRVGGRAELPSFFEPCPVSLMASWNFPFSVGFDGATQLLHLPTNPTSVTKMPLDVAVIFRPTPKQRAVLYFAKRCNASSLSEGDDSPLGDVLGGGKMFGPSAERGEGSAPGVGDA